LKRLLTEEGVALGKEMAVKNSEEIAQLLWEYSLNDKNNSELTKSLPEESLATKMVIAWCLSELKSETSKVKRAKLIENLLHFGIDESIDNALLEDINKLYELLDLKRDTLKSPIDHFDRQLEGITKSLVILESQNLATAIKETDLYDWWNIMMEYANVEADGRIIFA
jgi:hypothetical protein